MIDGDGRVPSCFPGSIAGPAPVLRNTHQTPADGIRVDVTDLLPDIFRRPEIPVIASASLPEAVVTLSVWLTIFHTLEEVNGIGTNPEDSPFGHRCFHGYQDSANPNILMGKHHDVDVFRHEDIGEKIIKAASSAGFEGLCQPLATSRT